MCSEQKFKSNRNIGSRCKYHIVGCPKDRRKVLIDGMDERFKQMIQNTAEEKQVEMIELEVMPDHVH